MNTPGTGVSGGAGGGYTADGATVSTTQTTNSSSYVDLATVGPSVTLTTGANVVVQVACGAANNNGSGFNGFVSVAVSGATTVAASDNFCASVSGTGAGFGVTDVANIALTGLTPGVNTFTLKYRVNGQTWGFYNRDIRVVLLS